MLLAYPPTALLHPFGAHFGAHGAIGATAIEQKRQSQEKKVQVGHMLVGHLAKKTMSGEQVNKDYTK